MRITALCGGTYVFGMELKALELLTILAERGHRVDVLANGWSDGEFIRGLAERGLPWETVYLGKLTKSMKPEHLYWMANTVARWPRALWQVHQRMQTFDPDVVLLFNRDAALLTAPVLRSRRCVFHVAELASPTAWTRSLYGILDRFVHRWIGVSEYIVNKLERFGIDSAKLRVVHNGVAETVAPVGTNGPRPGPVTIGICGQIGPWKGHDDLLDALARLRRQGRAFTCLVYGRGDPRYERALRERAQQLGIAGHVEWRGYTHDVPSMYASIDVLVVPSRDAEAFGLVAAEAGLSRVPVVATRSGGLPEIVVDGETGFLVDVERPEQLADRLSRLITSPELRAAMGAAGRRRVQALFTVERMTRGHERVFEELVAQAAA